MTKRPDEEPDLEDGLTTSERRRRRRRGGIRIPSDNVPRRTGSQPVISPVPEDPALAVSIAYAFGDSTSSGRAPTNLPPDDDLSADLGDLDDQTSIAEVPAAMSDGSVPMPIDDVVPDGRTRQMPAMSLESLGLSALDPDALDLDALESYSPAEVSAAIGASELAALPPAAPLPAVLPLAAPAPAAQPVAAQPVAAPAPAAPAVDLTRITGEVEAVDIMVDDMAADPVAEVTDEHGREDADELLRAGDGVPRRPMGRAATVALSEDDLEELLETVHGSSPMVPARPRAGTVPPAPPTQPGVDRIERPKPPTMPFLPIVGGVMALGAPPPMPSLPSGLAATASGSFVTPAIPPVAPPPAAAPALAAEDPTEHPWPQLATPGDAADSGEILAEEILEVEEQSRASPVDAFASVMTTPGAAAPTAAAGASRSSSPAIPLGERQLTQAPPPPPAATMAPPPPQAAYKPAPAPAPAPVKKSVAAAVATAPGAPVATAPAAMPGADDKRKRRGKPWFEELFDEDYLRTLPFLTPQATQAEATMVIESLGLQPGAAVLDLGCGYGRHAMELAARGVHVVGVDLSLPMLLRGADEAQRRGLDINFMHADMREIDFDAQFDGAYCLFSTFGFFDDETNKKTAGLVAKALKPGAKFMLEVLNRDYVIGDLPNRVWWEGDGCVVLEEVEFNYFSSRVQSKRSVVFDDGRQVEQEISLRVYSLHEIGKLLHAAGLRVVEVSGSMATKGRFLGNRSREIIVIAERKTGDTKG